MLQNTVFITGASSGIGAATVAYFAEKGWNVAATMRDPPEQSTRLTDSAVLTTRLDVTDERSIEQAIGATITRFGAIDVVVNNAGYALMGPLEAATSDDLRRQMETNLIGLAAVTRRVLPYMRLRKTGTIVNVSSIGGRMAFPYASAYHATKFAVEGLSESLRFELAKHGVRVKLVEPGGIRTNFITKGTDWRSHAAYEPAVEGFRAMSRRLNDALPGPDRVAEVIYRAATDRSTRLRYQAAPGIYPLMRRLLPDAIWRASITAALSRHAGSAARGDGTGERLQRRSF